MNNAVTYIGIAALLTVSWILPSINSLSFWVESFILSLCSYFNLFLARIVKITRTITIMISTPPPKASVFRFYNTPEFLVYPTWSKLVLESASKLAFSSSWSLLPNCYSSSSKVFVYSSSLLLTPKYFKIASINSGGMTLKVANL